RSEGPDDVMPAAVVVSGVAAHRAGGPRVDAEGDLAVRIEVDVPVVAARFTGSAVPEAYDLATGTARRPEPGFDAEGVQPLHGCGGTAGRGEAVEPGRRRALSVRDDLPGLSPDGVLGERHVVRARPVVSGRSRRLTQRPVVHRIRLQYGVGV